MTRIRTLAMASTSSRWMKPPSVKLVTSPRAHSRTSTTATVQSMMSSALFGDGTIDVRLVVLVDDVAEAILDVHAHLAGPLLDLADELIPVALGAGEIVVGEIAPRLLDATSQLLP